MTPEDYTDYEITKDENEWKYVERLLPYKIIPKPPTIGNKFPSGYKPASGTTIIKYISFASFIFCTKNT